GSAIAEIEPLADLDGGELRGVVADRRRHRPALPFGRLKSDDVVEGPLAARHLAVRQPAVEAFELLEACDALHHFGTRQRRSRQRFHRLPPCLRAIRSIVVCARQFPNKSRLTISRITSLVPSRIWCTRKSRNTRSRGWSRR